MIAHTYHSDNHMHHGATVAIQEIGHVGGFVSDATARASTVLGNGYSVDGCVQPVTELWRLCVNMRKDYDSIGVW